MTDLSFVSVDWPAIDGIHALTTTRGAVDGDPAYAASNFGGHVGDDPERVANNRKHLREELGLPSEPLWLNQIHGNRVVNAGAETGGPSPDADGAFTDRDGVVLAIMSADCLPVFLATRDGERLALVHAGWRGLADGVVEAGLAALDTDPGNVQVAFGPAIGQSAYEVGPEVREAFSQLTGAGACFAASGRAGHFYLDLYRLAARVVGNAGVEAPRLPDHCTHDHAERWFSFRRQGACGRMVSLLWRDSRKK